MQNNSRPINAGTDQYWQELREAYALILAAKAAAKRAKSAPLYTCGGYDENGDAIPVENLGPHDDFDEIMAELEGNNKALTILKSQGITRIGKWQVRSNLNHFARTETRN